MKNEVTVRTAKGEVEMRLPRAAWRCRKIDDVDWEQLTGAYLTPAGVVLQWNTLSKQSGKFEATHKLASSWDLIRATWMWGFHDNLVAILLKAYPATRAVERAAERAALAQFKRMRSEVLGLRKRNTQSTGLAYR